MADSALKYLQDALAHLDAMIEQEKKNLWETERRLEEIGRNVGQYTRERELVAEAIQKFLGKE